jgi:hypothetical protein
VFVAHATLDHRDPIILNAVDPRVGNRSWREVHVPEGGRECKRCLQETNGAKFQNEFPIDSTRFRAAR